MKERRKTPRKNRSAIQTTIKKLEQPKKPMINGTLIQVRPGEDKKPLLGDTTGYCPWSTPDQKRTRPL